MTEEVWREKKDYPNYMISNIGNVKRKEGYDSLGHYRKEKILKPKISKDGYYEYALCKDGKVKYFRAHRLVAEVFIPNPDNKPCIDHINTIRTDNTVVLNEDGSVNYEKTNLRWCTSKENHNNPLTLINHSIASSIPIIQYTKDGYILKVWDNAKLAADTIGTFHQTISKCCKRRYGYKSAGGFTWRYLHDQLADWLEEIQDEDMAA